MTTPSADLLLDGFGRVAEVLHGILDDVTPAELTFRADPDANTIAWLVWHVSRGLDLQIPADGAQLWPEWSELFGLPFDENANGYGQSSEEVGAVDVSASLLLGYFDAVDERTRAYLASVTDADLEQVVDARYDPPVTLAVRLVSVLSDGLQHAGQAGFIKGVARRSLA